MAASTSKTKTSTKSTGLKWPIQPTSLSLSKSQRKAAANVQAPATSTRSTPTTSRCASVEDVEDDDVNNNGGVLDRDGDSLIELSDDKTSQVRKNHPTDLIELSDDEADSEETELSGFFAAGIRINT
jgi:hypothetical protein